MLPVIFRVFGIPVSGYLFFYALGIAAGAVFIFCLSRREKLDPVETAAYLVLGVVSGLLGSRLLPALVTLALVPASRADIPRLLGESMASGGSFFGAVFASLLFAFLYSRRYFRGSYPRLWDITVIGIALGHGIGRLGCFTAGCCWGVPTSLPWGVRFATWGDRPHPLAGIPLHPVQLYEAAACIALSLALLLLWKRRRFPGQVFALYLAGYGLVRFLVEFLRQNPPGDLAWPGGLSWYQLFGLALLPLAWTSWRRFAQRPERVREKKG